MSPWRSLLLSLYYHVSFPYRWWRNCCTAADHCLPVTVLMYHRVADDHANDYTISNRMFARQIRWLAKHIDIVSLEEAQQRIRIGDNSRPCASITFDDGYAENCRGAIPLLIRERIPCTYFVVARNIMNGEPFAHDLAHGNRFLPNSQEQIRAMSAAGIEIGAHGYSHVDLGTVDDERILHREVVTSGEQLQDLVRRPVRYFAFPFGCYENLNARAFQMAYEAGYEAVCSAYGGYNVPGGDAYHIQRIAADQSMIRLKNRVTVDPRKIDVRRFEYELAGSREPRAEVGERGQA